MKKLYLSIGLMAALLAVGSNAHAQGTILLNNYDSGKGIFSLNTSTAAPAGTFVQVLGGASADSLAAIATTSAGNATIFTIQAGDVNGNGPGTGSFFDVGFGRVNGVAPQTTGFFQVRAWTGAATWELAQTTPGALAGQTVVFSQLTGTNPAQPATPNPTVLAMPSTIVLTPVPEPTTIALGILGAGSLLLIRRKK